MKKEYAPVIIPTLCRKEHLERCIESLRKNKYARETKIFIGLDFPMRPEYQQGHDAILQYLQNGISGFKEIVLFEHKENLGADANRFFLQDKVLQEYDTFIYTEDDNEFSCNFLEYMNKCLEKYKDDENILAVTGFNYPIYTDSFSGNIYTNNIYFSAWGYGTWKKKIESAHREINWKNFCSVYHNASRMRKLKKEGSNQYCNFVKGMLEFTGDLIRDNQVREIDLAYGIHMFSTGKKMIFPVKSMVRNWGYDGSGDNCENLTYDTTQNITHRNFDMRTISIDRASSFEEIVEEKQLTQEAINQIVSDYFEIPLSEKAKCTFAYVISRVLGLSKCKKIIASKK